MRHTLVQFSLRETGFTRHWPDKGADRLLDSMEQNLVALGRSGYVPASPTPWVGIAIDANGRKLDTDNRAIKGVYAAGAASGGLEGGPRLPSNKVLACSWISFFHWLTCMGCTPNCWPIWLIVLTPRTASNPTLALNSGRWTLRFFGSLKIYPFLSTVTLLNYYLKSLLSQHFSEERELICLDLQSGVHFRSPESV